MAEYLALNSLPLRGAQVDLAAGLVRHGAMPVQFQLKQPASPSGKLSVRRSSIGSMKRLWIE
jgi:hypothetical protein